MSLGMFRPAKLQFKFRIKIKTIPTDSTGPSALGTKRSWRRKLSTEVTFLWWKLVSTCLQSELCSGSSGGLRVCSGTLLTEGVFRDSADSEEFSEVMKRQCHHSSDWRGCWETLGEIWMKFTANTSNCLQIWTSAALHCCFACSALIWLFGPIGPVKVSGQFLGFKCFSSLR